MKLRTLAAICLLAFPATSFAEASGDAPAHTIIVTKYSYYVDGVRSETLEAFRLQFEAAPKKQVVIHSCLKSSTERLQAVLKFLKDTGVEAPYKLGSLCEEPAECEEDG